VRAPEAQLSQEPAPKKKAAGYLAMGGLLRGAPRMAAAGGLPERVTTALADEAALATRATGTFLSGWMRPAAGAAIAASVALLALAGLRQLDNPDLGVPAADDAAQLAAGDSTYTQPLAIDVMADWPGERLTQYYLSHGETSAELGANGILSRLVTLELRGGELVDVAQSAAEELETAAPATDNDASGVTRE